jgi:hypothetical protein
VDRFAQGEIPALKAKLPANPASVYEGDEIPVVKAEVDRESTTPVLVHEFDSQSVSSGRREQYRSGGALPAARGETSEDAEDGRYTIEDGSKDMV